jgi:hypothetical protein
MEINQTDLPFCLSLRRIIKTDRLINPFLPEGVFLFKNFHRKNNFRRIMLIFAEIIRQLKNIDYGITNWAKSPRDLPLQ